MLVLFLRFAFTRACALAQLAQRRSKEEEEQESQTSSLAFTRACALAQLSQREEETANFFAPVLPLPLEERKKKKLHVTHR